MQLQHSCSFRGAQSIRRVLLSSIAAWNSPVAIGLGRSNQGLAAYRMLEIELQGLQELHRAAQSFGLGNACSVCDVISPAAGQLICHNPTDLPLLPRSDSLWCRFLSSIWNSPDAAMPGSSGWHVRFGRRLLQTQSSLPQHGKSGGFCGAETRNSDNLPDPTTNPWILRVSAAEPFSHSKPECLVSIFGIKSDMYRGVS